jgi:hypothetical protein
MAHLDLSARLWAAQQMASIHANITSGKRRGKAEPKG